MPVCSYLVYSHSEDKEALVSQLNKIPECQTVEASNRDMLILVTETKDQIHEKSLQETLMQIPAIQNIALVYGQET